MAYLFAFFHWVTLNGTYFQERVYSHPRVGIRIVNPQWRDSVLRHSLNNSGYLATVSQAFYCFFSIYLWDVYYFTCEKHFCQMHLFPTAARHIHSVQNLWIIMKDSLRHFIIHPWCLFRIWYELVSPVQTCIAWHRSLSSWNKLYLHKSQEWRWTVQQWSSLKQQLILWSQHYLLPCSVTAIPENVKKQQFYDLLNLRLFW